MTTAQAYIDFKKELQVLYSDREADNITDWIFENVTSFKKWERRGNPHFELAEVHVNQLEKYLKELLQHKPVQYVLNEAWFYKMKFFVNENVLIPRPETEELVEWVVMDAKSIRLNNADKKNIRIIDIGTGSGCIPVSLMKELPGADVTAIDVSEKALMVAKRNADELNSIIYFLQIDFLNENEWDSFSQYDIIVSNPPYIPVKEKSILSKNVSDFEPGMALFVEDKAPFIFYEKIAAFSKIHLKEKGIIYVEVHEEYAEDVRCIFEKANLHSIIKKDIYGKQRMIKAIKQSF
ncbi:MAG: peptide chain release factor N(5)-glutamine methyltransferase [Bacteroidota bacterium]|nr:peptide chain release factor N(5)-glutamine methyltransferase [Bacteroidota bacterium]